MCSCTLFDSPLPRSYSSQVGSDVTPFRPLLVMSRFPFCSCVRLIILQRDTRSIWILLYSSFIMVRSRASAFILRSSFSFHSVHNMPCHPSMRKVPLLLFIFVLHPLLRALSRTLSSLRISTPPFRSCRFYADFRCRLLFERCLSAFCVWRRQFWPL